MMAAVDRRVAAGCARLDRVRAFGIGRSHRRRLLLHTLIGVDHAGFGLWRELDRGGLVKSGADARCAGEQRKGDFSEHRRTLYCFVIAWSAKHPAGARRATN